METSIVVIILVIVLVLFVLGVIFMIYKFDLIDKVSVLKNKRKETKNNKQNKTKDSDSDSDDDSEEDESSRDGPSDSEDESEPEEEYVNKINRTTNKKLDLTTPCSKKKQAYCDGGFQSSMKPTISESNNISSNTDDSSSDESSSKFQFGNKSSFSLENKSVPLNKKSKLSDEILPAKSDRSARANTTAIKSYENNNILLADVSVSYKNGPGCVYLPTTSGLVSVPINMRNTFKNVVYCDSNGCTHDGVFKKKIKFDNGEFSPNIIVISETDINNLYNEYTKNDMLPNIEIIKSKQREAVLSSAPET
jgi:hypothetical protein